MPLTPFHMGPALIIKTVAPKYFCLTAFAATQFFIDLESLFNLMNNRAPVHAFFHTYLGATLVSIIVFILSLWLLNPAIKFYNKVHGRGVASRIYLGGNVTWYSMLIGSFIGGYSHVFLDSIMHSDMSPLSPLSTVNVLLGAVSIPVLHVFCAVTLFVGGFWLLFLFTIGKYKV